MHEKIIFNSYTELVDRMMEVANDGGTAYTICFFEDAKAIIKELLSREGTQIASLNISEQSYCGYNKEYFISIDGDMLIDVEPAWHDKNEFHDAGYLWFDAEKVFVVGEANSAVIKCIDNEKWFEIEFDFSDSDKEFEDLIATAQLALDEIIDLAIEFDTLLESLGE